MNLLASMCPCGHAAFHHASLEQHKARIASTSGRYAPECKGGSTSHCRCTTERGQVIAAAWTAGAK